MAVLPARDDVADRKPNEVAAAQLAVDREVKEGALARVRPATQFEADGPDVLGLQRRALAYLALYTHRVAIANSRLVAITDNTVSFLWKDYRQVGRSKVMRPEPAGFTRRFLLQVLPPGFHRIRHFGFLANARRAARLALYRQLLARRVDHQQDDRDREAGDPPCVPSWRHGPQPDTCPCCGDLTLFRSTLARAPS